MAEEAVFSAHLFYVSSGELFWGAILKTNLVVGGVSILVLLLIIGFVHIYLNKLFTSLEEGIKLIGWGRHAFVLIQKNGWAKSCWPIIILLLNLYIKTKKK